MTAAVRDVLSSLMADASALNPDVQTAYSGAEWVTIWTEGGEWPAFSQEYVSFEVKPVCRGLRDAEYSTPATVDMAKQIIQSRFDSGETVVALSMDCGSGKSTGLAHYLHSLKYGMRTFIVQPSLVCAASLAVFMAKVGAVYARCAADFPTGRSFVYTNAGAMVDLILRGKLRKDDVIVLDEAHCVTLTYELLVSLLSRITNNVMALTASTSYSIKALRGVKLVEVDGVTPQLSDAMATSEHVMVGVADNLSYAAPANALIGMTLNLKVIYDTGLRPDPRLIDKRLDFGERKCTEGEIIQMVGRLGRLGTSGTAYYNPKARAIKYIEGLSLYDVLLKSIFCAVGIATDIPAAEAIAIWKASGMLHDVRPGTPEFEDAVSTRPSSIGSAPPTYDKAGMDSLLEGGNEATGAHSKGKEMTGKTKYRVRRYSDKENGGHRATEVALTVKRDTGVVVARQPDPAWRPFVKEGAVKYDHGASGDLVTRYLDRVGKAVEEGDLLFPSVLPKADERVTTVTSRQEARLVLAGRMLPAFTELESMSVVVEWNKMVDSLGGRPMPAEYSTQFVDYFRRYWAHTTK